MSIDFLVGLAIGLVIGVIAGSAYGSYEMYQLALGAMMENAKAQALKEYS